MKSIREFVEGKIRRSENEAVLSVDARARAPDPELGAFEVELVGPKGRIELWDRGLVLGSGTRILYEAIERVILDASGPFVDILTAEGGHRLDSSAAGAEVVHATLRWIGHVRLRRNISS